MTFGSDTLNGDGAGAVDRMQESRTFEEPWQAQAMAVAANLVDAGHLLAGEGSAELGAEIAAAKAHGQPDTSANYFACALRALERLAQQKGMATAASLASEKQAWIEAYEATPHRRPVEFAAARGSEDA